MKTAFLKSAYLLTFCMLVPVASQADIINFNFTGRLILADSTGAFFDDKAISAALAYDTSTGLGTSNLSITSTELLFGYPLFFHDITMNYQSGTNLVEGQVLVDWIVNYDMPMHVEWDATGLLNAIDYGLQAGDVLSGSDLYHDINGNGVQDDGEFLYDIGSTIPYSDSLQLDPAFLQGPAPLAATVNSLGLDDSTPFQGFVGYFDIGSGNSMHVVSVSSVPLPAAVWLFGSGLIGLMGIAKRKKILSH